MSFTRPQSLSSEALLGRCLTGPERQSHEVIRHLADYVLIWAGEQGDDIAKSPHMARIAASVYPDVCPDDPLCSQFVLERQSREPSEMMRRSLLWRLYTHGGNATAHPELFQEAYTSKYGLVRIFKAPRAVRWAEFARCSTSRKSRSAGPWTQATGAATRRAAGIAPGNILQP